MKNLITLLFLVQLIPITLIAKAALAVQQIDSSRNGGFQRMHIPTTVPEKDPAGLWTLQNELLSLAEDLVGKRDLTKKIYQPSFGENGPLIRNSPTLDGAFAELGQGSKVYWPTVVFEMAHETLHLLNPIPGSTNWLEEGVAVDFSIYAQKQYGLVFVQEPKSGPYFEALQMVRSLPGGTFAAAKRIRTVYGSLSAVTLEQLKALFDSEPALLQRLSEKCTPR